MDDEEREVNGLVDGDSVGSLAVMASLLSCLNLRQLSVWNGILSKPLFVF